MMQVDAQAVIDELTAQVGRLAGELAVARAQVKALQSAQPAQTVDVPDGVGEV